MSAPSITGSQTATVTANLSISKGEDVTVTDTITATDITGWSLTFSLKRQYGDASALLTKTVGAGITITSAGSGIFTVAIARADTTGLDPRTYVYDIQRTDSGHQTVLTTGNLTLLPEVE
jgi:hypothetical protein